MRTTTGVRSARRLAAVLVAGTALAGCTSSAPQGSPSTPSATSATSGSSTAAEFAALAARGVPARYTASYDLVSTGSPTPNATVAVAKGVEGLRIAVTSQGSTAIYLSTSSGTVSCQTGGGQSSCLRVAAPGSTPPPLFDPGIQRIFTTTLAAIAAQDAGVHVAPSGTVPGPGGQGVATCADIAGPGVDAGTYCLLDSGIPDRAQFAAGALRLTSVG
ncbi:MAG: hypothetical protein ACYCXA_04740, partial [Actinomycetes bacterium]